MDTDGVEERARHRRDILQACDYIEPETRPALTTGSCAKTITIAPGETSEVLFKFDQDIPGPNISLEVMPTPEFSLTFEEFCLIKNIKGNLHYTTVAPAAIHQSRTRYGFYRVANFSDTEVMIKKGTPMVKVNKWEDPDSENLILQCGNLFKGVDPTGATSARNHPTVESRAETQDQAPSHHVNERSPEANSAAFEGLNAANLRMFADHRTNAVAETHLL